MSALASFFSGSGDIVKWIGGVAAFLGIIPVLWKSCTCQVETGTVAVKLRWGKVIMKNGVPELQWPGTILRIPGIHTVKKVSTQDQTHNLPEMTVERMGIQYMLKGSVTYRVLTNDPRHPFDAIFATDTLAESVVNLSANSLRTVFECEEYCDSQLSNSKVLVQLVARDCEEETLRYGSGLVAVNLTSKALSLGEKLSRANVERGTLGYLASPQLDS